MRVKGEGPVPSAVMLIGEAPGREEEMSGRPFVGKSGRELDRILEREGLDRERLYVTNICKLRPPYVDGKQQPPSAEDIARDEGELYDEMLQVRPLWIGALGRVATRWLCGDGMDMESSWGLAYPLSDERRRGLVDTQAGIPSSPDRTGVLGEAGAWAGRVRVVPLYHPAAGLHNVDLSRFVWRGLSVFSAYVRGKLHPVVPVDGFPHPEYLRGLLAAGLFGVDVACDTEGLAGRVWGGSLSSEGGRARVFAVRDAPEAAGVLTSASRIIFHNALHDVPILAEIGVGVDWLKVEDTFLMAYCLTDVPMGLKQLARRFCGMEMQSYLDVVAPADRRLAMEWVGKAMDARRCPLCEGTGKVWELTKRGDRFKKDPVKCQWEDESGRCIDGGMWPERQEQLKYDWDTGKWKLSKGWSVGRYLARLRDDIEQGTFEPDEDGEIPSVRKRIHNWPEDVVEEVEKVIGPLPEPTLDDIDPDAATFYSARDADATIRLYPILRERIEEMELEEAYRLDLSVIPVAAEMQKNGMYIDRGYFERFVGELEHDNQIILARLESRAGRPINPASGDQVAGLLFGDRNLSYSRRDEFDFGPLWADSFDLQPERWTKSGKRASVDDKVLEGLKLKHAENRELVETIDLILDYRIRDKIRGTYASKLPSMADSDDRIHTTIKPCRTATFRWASADPNLQNIPTRPKNGVDLGRRVRQGFVAPEGYVLGSWDFDQIEMRVLAWYSQDENLLRVFRENIDIHSLTAALVFRVPFDQFMAEMHDGTKDLQKLRKDQRASAKNIGFGVVYGVTAKGLKAQMELRGQHWTEEECQKLINMYLHEAYPGVGRFMAGAHAEARRNGFVRSLFGHIRYVPGVHSSIASVREEALRQAANFKIQATAAELLKLSMKKLYYEYKDALDDVGSMLLMAVHDELLLQVPDNELARSVTDLLVTDAMTNPYPLEGVEVGTTGKYEYNWGLLK